MLKINTCSLIVAVLVPCAILGLQQNMNRGRRTISHRGVQISNSGWSTIIHAVGVTFKEIADIQIKTYSMEGRELLSSHFRDSVQADLDWISEADSMNPEKPVSGGRGCCTS